MTGRIVVAATPIGNISDGSPRLWQALQDADVVAAEDTRVTRELAGHAGIKISGELVALHDHNEAGIAQNLVERAKAGATVLLVSDAGTPLVSDPGYKVVVAAAEAGVTVESLPGPSAVIAALSVSALPTDRFSFEGFVPRKDGERTAMLESLAGESRTMVFFESPHRVTPSLEAMAAAFGEQRRASVSRELTKKFEETVRGPLSELVAWAHSKVIKGELVIVVEGRPASAPDLATVVAEALRRIGQGERAKQAVSDLATTFGLSQRELYAAVVAARSQH